LRLRFLEFPEGLRVVHGIGIDLDLRGAGAGIHHRFQHLLFLRRIALHRLHEVGNEVGAALVLILHIRPFRLGLFVEGRDVVDAAAGDGKRQQQRGEDGHSAGKRTQDQAHDASSG
jgi:hypothetical protein